MKSKDLFKILNEFKKIKPTDGFVLRSKSLILSQPKNSPLPNSAPVIAGLRGYAAVFARTLSFSLAGILLVFSIYYATRELSPLFLPGLNQDKVIAEAEMINSNIDIQIAELQYFNKTTSESNLVLNQTSNTQLNHLNQTIIAKESKEISMPEYPSDPQNQEINDIIKRLSQ